ncbi:MAG: beta-galactosidase [Planctomycetaceae bacterium]|nr:beta-galactosidase [Planctomycetaceae bacterium]
MTKIKNKIRIFLMLSVAAVAGQCIALAANELILFDAKSSPVESVIRQDVTLEIKNGVLEVTTGLENRWPGIQWNGNWNLENKELLLVVTNHDSQEMSLHCRLDTPDPSAKEMGNTYTANATIAPGETKEWRIQLPQFVPVALRDKFFGMRGTPFGMNLPSKESTFDPKSVSELRFFVNQSNAVQHWGLEKIVAVAKEPSAVSAAPVDRFFPMIDAYGQYMHKDWPGKIHNDTDFKKAIDKEQADMTANPGPNDRNKYGGWSTGPKQKATGHFRTEKIDGKWWLVDPDGCLFWSHGVDCVTENNAVTPITDREFYFAGLPQKDGPFGFCYGSGNWAPHNYYEGRGPYVTFDFSTANLKRKYGDDWRQKFDDLAHKRLQNWGMNTIANWSSPRIYQMRRTPYTETLNIDAQPIRGSDGYWGKFLDPFDPAFRDSLRRSAERAARTSGNDPWCIGYFVQNEISWGDETSLAVAALMSPSDQPVKIAVVDLYLKAKYAAVEKLNEVWGTAYKNWDDLLASTAKPDMQKAKSDLEACYTLIAEQYFRVIKEELQKACPDKLYLGCRFAWGNELATRAAAKYCDVISFNQYKYHLDDFRLPEGIDMPCIIGEFHFGALDRGMFHTGLCPTESQEARAAAYRRYLISALENPYITGTHWFQYMDQATTGRGDGENYQIGLLDSCDTPYPETIHAVREIGKIMYEQRMKAKKTE